MTTRQRATVGLVVLGLVLAAWYWSPVEREKRRDRDVARCIGAAGYLTQECLLAYGWSEDAAKARARAYQDGVMDRITGGR